MASAAIQPARALGKEVETVQVLAEKMRLPTYYSQESFKNCGVAEAVSPGEALAKALNPNVARNSAFVSVSFKSPSVERSAPCLNAVLEDIKRTQAVVAQAQLKAATANIDLDLQVLKVAEDLVAFTLKDKTTMSTPAGVNLLLAKQDEVARLKRSVSFSQQLLLSPDTQSASFVAPVFASPIKVEPKRALISVISVLAGGFLGLMILLSRRVIRFIQEQQRRKAGLAQT